MIHAQRRYQLLLLFGCGKQLGSVVRIEQLTWLTVEGDHHRRQAHLLCFSQHGADEQLMPPVHAVEASEGGHTAPFEPHTFPQVGRFHQNNHNFTKNIWRFPKNNVPLQPDSAKWHKILGLVAQLVRATDS